MIHILKFFLCAIIFQTASAEIIVVQNPTDPNTPITTLYFGSAQAKATLLVVTGGSGKPKFNSSTGETKQQTVLMLRSMGQNLADNQKINIVVFISPNELSEATRYSDKHLEQVARVIDFYSKKNNQSLWLMGHSFGSISVTEVLNRYPQARRLVTGLITSGSMNNISITQDIQMPILFLHHEYDRCQGTTYRAAKNNFEAAQKINTRITTLNIVSGGDDRGQPCSDGYHLYAGSYRQAGDYIAEFIQKNAK